MFKDLGCKHHTYSITYTVSRSISLSNNWVRYPILAGIDEVVNRLLALSFQKHEGGKFIRRRARRRIKVRLELCIALPEKKLFPL